MLPIFLFNKNNSKKNVFNLLTGITNQGQSEPVSNDNEGVLQDRPVYRTGASLSDAVYLHTHLWWGPYSSAGDIVSLSTTKIIPIQDKHS